MYVPRGDAAAKARLLRALIEEAKRDPGFHRIALSIPRLYRVPEYDWLGELDAVKDWTHRHVRYTRDPAGLETFRAPMKTIEFGAGDCDDLVSLGSALIETLGYHTRHDVIRGPRRNAWSHIKLDVGIPPGVPDYWIPLELTMRGFGVGKDAPAKLVAERAYFYDGGRVERSLPAPRIEFEGIGGCKALARRI